MKNNYLEAFCNSISDEDEIKKTCFTSLYETSITKYTPYLESEIMENLLILPSEKKEDYINFAIDKINKTPYRNIDKNSLDKWLKKYDVDLSTFPKFSNLELTNILKTPYIGHLFNTNKEQQYIFDIQIDFSHYAAMLEAEKIVKFLKSKNSKNVEIGMNNSKKELSKSEIIVDDFGKHYGTLSGLNRKKNAELDLSYGNDPWADVSHINEKYDIDIEELKQDLKSLLNDLYYASNDDNYYYFDCSLAVYINHYKTRKEEYIKTVLDATEEDFIKAEVKLLSQPNNRMLDLGFCEVCYDSFIDFDDKYRIPLVRKFEYLNQKLKLFGKTIVIEESESDYDVMDGSFYRGYVSARIIEQPLPKNSNPGKTEISQESFNSKDKTVNQLTINQIVLLLQETGFFTHPKIENAPKTKQSELISKICGLNAKNIKSKIENLDKNHKELGANHQKDIDKIEDILNSLE